MKSSHVQEPSFRRTELPSVAWRAAVDALDEWNELRIWHAPDGTGFIGIGAARVFDSPDFHQNVSRFRDFAAAATDLVVPAFAASAFEPRARTASEWSDFRRCEVVVPQATVVVTDTGTELITCSTGGGSGALHQRVRRLLGGTSPAEPTGPSDLEFEWDDETFEARVSAALDRLQSVSRLEKIVVARCLSVAATRAWQTSHTLTRLSRRYPGCFEFALQRGRSAFLGATPERLVRVRDGKASTGALAGSARRGETPEDDQRLARALLESQKDREEHDVVTRMITAKLEPVSTSVDAPDTPELMRLSNVQHLYTPIEATLADDVDIGDIARRLHPTPAVGGMPRDDAREAIGELEDFDRGLYAGFLGWVDSRGDGDLSVSLRCGLLQGERAMLYAGSGIVPESVPKDEAAETRAKLGAMLDALRGDADA